MRVALPLASPRSPATTGPRSRVAHHPASCVQPLSLNACPRFIHAVASIVFRVCNLELEENLKPIVKLLQTKDKQKPGGSQRKKAFHTEEYKEQLQQLYPELQAVDHAVTVLKFRRKNKCEHRTLYPVKMYFKSEGYVEQPELSYIAGESRTTLDNILEVNKVDQSLDSWSRKKNDAHY